MDFSISMIRSAKDSSPKMHVLRKRKKLLHFITMWHTLKLLYILNVFNCLRYVLFKFWGVSAVLSLYFRTQATFSCEISHFCCKTRNIFFKSNPYFENMGTFILVETSKIHNFGVTSFALLAINIRSYMEILYIFYSTFK